MYATSDCEFMQFDMAIRGNSVTAESQLKRMSAILFPIRSKFSNGSFLLLKSAISKFNENVGQQLNFLL